MRYRPAMVMLVSVMMAMAAASTTPASVQRFAAGSSASATVSARIVRTSARIGASFAPPLPRMTPRTTTVSAADGRPVAALVYDFE